MPYFIVMLHGLAMCTACHALCALRPPWCTGSDFQDLDLRYLLGQMMIMVILCRDAVVLLKTSVMSRETLRGDQAPFRPLPSDKASKEATCHQPNPTQSPLVQTEAK